MTTWRKFFLAALSSQSRYPFFLYCNSEGGGYAIVEDELKEAKEREAQCKHFFKKLYCFIYVKFAFLQWKNTWRCIYGSLLHLA